MGIFAEHAGAYAERGLRVFPCGGETGKKPAIKGWRNVGRRAVDELARKFPHANIGFIDGDPGGVTRVDVDDPSLLDDCIYRFGDTPVIFSTPSGGYHLCYRANGEGRHTFFEGERIDILGAGGFGVAPPSISPEKGSYKFLRGTIADLERLTPARGLKEALEALQKAEKPSRGISKPLTEMAGGDGRNKELFKQARIFASTCDNEFDYYEMVVAANKHFAEPLPLREVQSVARSAWKYKREGRLMLPGGDAAALLRAGECEALEWDPYAIMLTTKLRLSHGAKHGQPFHLTNGTAKALGISVPTFRKARDKTEAANIIEILERPKRGKRTWCKARLVA